MSFSATRFGLVILVSALLCASGVANSNVSLPTDVASGWGSKSNWRKSMPIGFKSHGYKIVSAGGEHPIRRGKNAIRFEVRPGDCGRNSDWNDCKNDRERHELSQRTNRHVAGDNYWFAYSLFIPEDTPSIWPTKVHIGQLQQDNPVFWLMSWTTQGYLVDVAPPGRFGRTLHTRKIIDADDLKGKWHDILLNMRFSTEKDGYLRIYLNNKKMYEYNGKTIDKGEKNRFKFGIYRSFVSRYIKVKRVDEAPKQVVYFDEVHRGTKLAKVDYVGVERLQQRLADEGLYTGVIDGLWGKNTRNATNALLESLGAEPIEDYDMSIWENIFGSEAKQQ